MAFFRGYCRITFGCEEIYMAHSCKAIITAEDGHSFCAYLATPEKPQKGGIILIHEIFGVTPQMKTLADKLAFVGYKAIVPSLFDRIQPNACLDYSETNRGKGLAGACKREYILLDLEAVTHTLNTSITSVIGYCWGGGISYFAACNLPINSGVSFYGTQLPSYLHQQSKCPFQFHFGGQDQTISSEIIEQVRAANPDSEIHIYPNAGHAFANQARSSFHAASNYIAERRLLEFLCNHIYRANQLKT